MKYLLPLLLLSACAHISHDNIHTRTATNVAYYLNREANQLTETAIQQAFSNWNSNSHFVFNYQGRHHAGLKKDGKNTISFVTSWPRHIPPTKIAWCQNWFDRDGRIIESDILFNMNITAWTTLQTRKPHAYIIEGVLTHEIGHMIGLGHSSNSNCLMKTTSSYQESYFEGRFDAETLSMYSNLYY